jgi:hypothetical protein
MLIEAHVALMPSSGKLVDGQRVTTLAGRTLQLEDVARATKCGDHIILETPRFLISGSLR